MTIALSERIQAIKPSATLAVSQKARELRAAGKDVISLSAGEPDFPTPEHIKEAAIAAINANHSHYTNVDGIIELKQAVVDKLQRENNLSFTTDEIIFSTGAKQSIFNALEVLLNPGDEVLIPAPYWVSYPDMVKLTGAKPVFITTDIQQHFKITAEQLEKSITAHTKICFLNSPSNPTGVEYSADELKALGAVFKKHPHIAILCDDIYEHLRWSGKSFTTLLNVCPELKSQIIIINGVSKAYAMTGWRIGYAAAPAAIAKAMKKLQSQTTSNACVIAQYAAMAALNGGLDCIQSMVAAFKKRGELVTKAFANIPGFECLPVTASLYAFVNIEQAIKNKNLANDIEFADYLLEQANIAVVPGSPFGLANYIRISIATSEQNLNNAIERIQSIM